MSANFNFPFPESTPSRGLSPAPASIHGENRPTATNIELSNLKADIRQVTVTVREDGPASGIRAAPPPRMHLGDPQRSATPTRKIPTPQPISRSQTPAEEPPQRSNESTPTLVQQNNNESTEPETPVMRSMFPRFNPDVPLARQSYYPHADAVPAHLLQNHGGSRSEYSPSLRSRPNSPLMQNHWGVRNTWSGINLPGPPSLDPSVTNLSTPEELLDLWTIANGQDSSEAIDSYTLRLKCDDLIANQEVLTLRSSQSPMYTLQAMSNEVSVARSHPIDQATSTTITTPTLLVPSEITPLVSVLIPKLAEIRAVEQANNIAISHQLSPTDTSDLIAEALLRAQSNNAVSLLWDSDSSRYYMMHPSLSSDDSAELIFPITIVPSVSITILSPSNVPFLTLSLATNVLTLHNSRIAALPSPYILDSLVSTLLTLLLHLHRHTSLLTSRHGAPTHLSRHASVASFAPNLPVFAPPPTRPLTAHTRAKSTKSVMSTRSVRSTRSRRPGTSTQTLTNAPFSPDLDSPTSLDLEKGIAPELRKSNTGVDLSKFQTFDLQDESLGRGTRAVLRVLYWGFGVLVWILGVGLGVLAAMVVCVGKGMKRL